MMRSGSRLSPCSRQNGASKPERSVEVCEIDGEEILQPHRLRFRSRRYAKWGWIGG